MAIITVLVVAVAMLLVMITTVVVVPVDLVVGGVHCEQQILLPAHNDIGRQKSVQLPFN